ncbi:MAG: methyltransferase domain-containing protein [bacterium]
MLQLFKRKFSRETPTATVEVDQSELAQLKQSIEDLLKSERPLMLENQLSGWFNDETGELYEGFKIQAEDTVVDVGCGDAPFVSFCAGRGAEIIFADIDVDKIASMHGKLANTSARALRPLVTDANPLPLVDGVATKVVAMEVLEHVDDPAQFIAELVRVGKSGAQYLLTVPGYAHEKVQKELAPDSYFQKPNHIRIFQPGELEQLASDAGLVVEKSAGYGFYWSMWWFLFWACEQDLSEPWHPILENWTRTWLMLLKTDQGPRVKSALDATIPKSHAIIARKA